MSERISALMDGELDQEEAVHLIAAVAEQSDLRQAWATYHLIGDVLRELPQIPENFSVALSARLASEPTVLSPYKPKRRGEAMILPMAASFAAAALVVVAVFKLSATPSVSPHVVPQSVQSAPIAKVNGFRPDAIMTQYLIAHQEFSPNAAMEEVRPYQLAAFRSSQGGPQ
ncbi:MAG: sigma-E factor negative regulatory protein [Betaproteobacteria bacterium]|nr:sigma-E factor negative regulatory protein [Betaproteobacteria bacterium]